MVEPAQGQVEFCAGLAVAAIQRRQLLLILGQLLSQAANLCGCIFSVPLCLHGDAHQGGQKEAGELTGTAAYVG